MYNISYVNINQNIKINIDVDSLEIDDDGILKYEINISESDGLGVFHRENISSKCRVKFLSVDGDLIYEKNNSALNKSKIVFPKHKYPTVFDELVRFLLILKTSIQKKLNRRHLL